MWNYVTPKIREYVIPGVIRSKLIKISKGVQLIFVRVKYSKIILNKFKVVKFNIK